MKNIGSRFFHYIRVEKFILVVLLKTTRLIYALIQCNMNISKFKFLELVKHFNNECSIINILNMLSFFFSLIWVLIVILNDLRLCFGAVVITYYPVGIYLFKFKNGNTRKMCENRSKCTRKTSMTLFCAFIVSF